MNSRSKGRFTNPFSAVFTGVKDLFYNSSKGAGERKLPDMTGKTCLVTGANSGLGFGISVQLARKGATVVMACRKNYDDALHAVKKLSSSNAVELRILDLTSIQSISDFVTGLVEDGVKLDVAIHNAGVTTPKAVELANGLDEMFMVNYLSKFVLINLLVKAKIYTVSASSAEDSARVILVSSDSHQGASAIDWEHFGRFEPYKSPNRAISLYSYNKLLLNTYGVELSRRLTINPHRAPEVFIMCPGPVNTNIIRNAPPALRLVLKGVFHFFFKE